MKEKEEQQAFELKSRLTREQEVTTKFEAELKVNVGGREPEQVRLALTRRTTQKSLTASQERKLSRFSLLELK